MEFNYTIDPSAAEPIMFVDKHIGMCDTDGEGIMGDKFTKELMLLDTLGKKSIQVWINSGGGVVTDGEQIYNAILNCKTPVDTHNGGTCASIAGPIFLAGRNRTMMDFAKIMMHPVSGGDAKSSKAFEDSICTMLSARSFLSKEQVSKLMAKTSWIFADDAKTMGLCTDIKQSAELNTNITNRAHYKNVVNKFLNNNTPTITNMSKVTNRLGLTEHANEDSINAAIDALENKYKVEAAENKSKFDKFVDELAGTKKAKDEAEARYNEMKAKYDEMEKAKADNEAARLGNEAKDKVGNAVKLGKIENKAETIEMWEKQYVASPETTNKLIEAIPVNKNAPKSIIEAAKTEENKDGVVETTMNSFRAKHLAAYKSKNKNRK